MAGAHSTGNKTRTTAQERLKEDAEEWQLSRRLFGKDAGYDINDLEEASYVYFLDHVQSHDDLIAGLRELSPLADDALEVAERMSNRDFSKFKLALARERECHGQGEESAFPAKYRILVLPRRFIQGSVLAEQFAAPLGAVLVRMLELESEKTF